MNTENTKTDTKTITYRGQLYKNLNRLINTLKISRNIIERNIRKKGLQLNEAIDQAILKKINKYTNNSFKCIEEAQANYDLTDDSKFIEFVISLEDKKTTDYTNSIMYKGNLYPSLESLCQSLNIYKKAVTKRLKQGSSLDEAINSAVQSSERYKARAGQQIRYEGTVYNLGTDMDKLNVDTEKFNELINQGFSKAEALERSIIKEPSTATVTNTSENIHHERNSNNLEKVKSSKKKSIRMPITYNGVTYKSLNQACVELDISLATVRSYRKNNFTPDKAIEKAMQVKRTFNFRGIRYANISLACKALHFTRNKLAIIMKTHNLNKEQAVEFILLEKINKISSIKFNTFDEALTHYEVAENDLENFLKSIIKLTDDKTKSDSTKHCIYKNKEYPSFMTLCNLQGVNYALATSYVKQGMSIEEAIDKILKNNPVISRRFIYEGKEYNDYTDLCRYLKISPYALIRYINIDNLSVEEAVQKLKETKPKKWSYGNISCSTKKQLMTKLGIDVSSVNSYERKGLTLEEAITMILKHKSNYKKRRTEPKVFRNVTYKTFEEMFDDYMVSRNEIYRLTTQSNLSFEEAMYRAIRNKINYFIKNNTYSLNKILDIYKINDEPTRNNILSLPTNSISDAIINHLKNN